MGEIMISSKEAQELPLETFKKLIDAEELILDTLKKIYQIRCEMEVYEKAKEVSASIWEDGVKIK
jgi:hypothetical protein